MAPSEVCTDSAVATSAKPVTRWVLPNRLSSHEPAWVTSALNAVVAELASGHACTT